MRNAIASHFVPLLARILGFALGVVFFAIALVFASVLALVAGVAVIVLWAYLYWRARTLGRRAPGPARPGAVVIEGEYRVEREPDRDARRDAAGPQRESDSGPRG
ncbi:MAG: hypothetical protein KJ025_03390 [Burkholderiales bacterium]|nr:hypothetical protein [Burkholderiales bacterium]